MRWRCWPRAIANEIGGAPEPSARLDHSRPKKSRTASRARFRARAPWHPCLTTSAPRLFQRLACHCANEVGDHGHGGPAHEDLGDTAILSSHGRMLRLGFWLEPAQIGCCRSGSCDKTRCAAALWRAPLWLRAEGMRLAADLPQAGREQGDGLGSGQATALIKSAIASRPTTRRACRSRRSRRHEARLFARAQGRLERAFDGVGAAFICAQQARIDARLSNFERDIFRRFSDICWHDRERCGHRYHDPRRTRIQAHTAEPALGLDPGDTARGHRELLRTSVKYLKHKHFH